jgi:N-glycosylase/DNA lyase
MRVKMKSKDKKKTNNTRDDPCDESAAIEEVCALYKTIRDKVTERVEAFREISQRGDEEEIFTELVFCLFTPQSKAQSCWAAVERIRKANLLCEGTRRQLIPLMEGVRFMYTKADNLIRARSLFIIQGRPIIHSLINSLGSSRQQRDWLVANVRGLGYKEASHFLRNVGHGLDLAILDRHILRNLCVCGSIDNLPATLPRKTYLAIEDCMRALGEKTNIPLSHLDLVLWYKQTGSIFK